VSKPAFVLFVWFFATERHGHKHEKTDPVFTAGAAYIDHCGCFGVRGD
jgi:hypothetical protein